MNRDLPSLGDFVHLRRRPGQVQDITPFRTDTAEGTYHLVEVEFVDDNEFPRQASVLWEREIDAAVRSRNFLPDLAAGPGPDDPDRLSAFLDSQKWTSVVRVPSQPDRPEKNLALVSTAYSAIKMEDYQVYPLYKAMLMPRISLMLADDVGLGKTIEAGLIARELLTRRRIRRILVVCPASLQQQWQEELEEKFHLRFTVLDRRERQNVQKRLGMDANPWTVHSRIICSMDYMRQPHVLEGFMASTERLRSGEGSLPWDLLIVDEAHNFRPNRFADDSQRTRMLRQIGSEFEHRLFLTATPHDGYTFSFTGLLELLDPVRFRQTAELSDTDRSQISQVVVRRTKSEVNESSFFSRFSEREVRSLDISMSEPENELHAALRSFRRRGHELARDLGRREQRLMRFVFALLNKRLLSSSYAFARTWWRHLEGIEDLERTVEEADYARRRSEQDTEDDRERQLRDEEAAQTIGAWARILYSELETEIDHICECLRALGLASPGGLCAEDVRPDDAKWQRFLDWVEDYLTAEDGDLRSDERVIVFTEYKDTLDYLTRRLRHRGIDEPVLMQLYGGVSSSQRREIKDAFNDPDSSLRILVATDAAAEGLNLQMSCRYVVHWDIPWNPMRLEQRNGRVDRHGQSRDVSVFHFVSRQDNDMQFLHRVAEKVNQIREDLGMVSDVLDRGVQEHFTIGEWDPDDLVARADQVREGGTQSRDLSYRDNAGEEDYRRALECLQHTEEELGLDPESMAAALDCALRQDLRSRYPVLEAEPDDSRIYRIGRIPPSWDHIIDRHLRLQRGASSGALPRIAFDPQVLEHNVDGRIIFRPRQGIVLLRLGHPLMQHAMRQLKRNLWGGRIGDLNRWTLVARDLPRGAEGAATLHLLIRATNELREVVHEEVYPIHFELRPGGLQPAGDTVIQAVSEPFERLGRAELEAWQERIAELWIEQDVDGYFTAVLDEERQRWRPDLAERLRVGRDQQMRRTREMFKDRLREIRKRQRADYLETRQKEIEDMQFQRRQMTFLVELDAAREREIETRALEIESARREVERLEKTLERERDRMLQEVIPRRFSLSSVEVQPLAVEITVDSEEAIV